MTTSVVLSLFDRTGNMVKPWAQDGYECWCVDTQHTPGVTKLGNIIQLGADILSWEPPNVSYITGDAVQFVAVFGFPPCTHLAASGAWCWKGKGLKALAEAIGLVARCADICNAYDAPWMIENPVGALSSHWRKPDFYFDPCDYAGYLDNCDVDAFTKRTCLWTGNNFIMPEKKPVQPQPGNRTLSFSPSAQRQNLRSVTPEGFAKAVFLANAPNCPNVQLKEAA